MKKIRVKTSREYSVIVGGCTVEALPTELKSTLKASRLLVVTDSNVAPLHLDALVSRLGGYEVHTLTLPAGEEHKTLDSVVSILTKMKENSFDRDDAVIALGGGVVGDIAAFSASVYMRGIDFVNVPTTLLSQVDSSVGGKTGVDFLGAKNAVGSFYQPRLVICDTDHLKTLSPSVFADGCAEVIKYAFIGDPDLLTVIENGIDKNVDDVVYRCVNDKNLIVSRDEFDRGDRALLNFGHTVGHAVESLSGYTVSHGSGVAIGMSVITRGCEKKGICPEGVYDRLTAPLRRNGLPTSTEMSAEALIDAIKNDKKKSGELITVIIPTDLCRCVTKKMTFGELHGIIEEGLK